MKEVRKIIVGIGEMHATGDAVVLSAILGSCVGIAFSWKKKNICGLAHCLLPDSESSDLKKTPGKFVSSAIPALLRLMKVEGSDLSDIEVQIAGGANMLEGQVLRPHARIGESNVAMAKKVLRDRGLIPSRIMTGGYHGHRLEVYCHSGIIRVSSLALS